MALNQQLKLKDKMKARFDGVEEKGKAIVEATDVGSMVAEAESKAGSAIDDAKSRLDTINLDMADLGIPNPANLDDLMPAPLANLQDKMGDLAGLADDPAGFLGKIDEIKSQMPDVDLTSQLDAMGIDGAQVMDMAGQFNTGAASDKLGEGGSKLAKGLGGLMDTASDLKSLKDAVKDPAGALLGGAKSDLLGKLAGAIPGADALASFDIANKIPNFEMGADGIMKKLGFDPEFKLDMLDSLDLKEMKLDLDTEKLTPKKKVAFSGVAKTNVTIQDQGKQSEAVEARKKRDKAYKDLKLETDPREMATGDVIEFPGRAPIKTIDYDKLKKVTGKGGEYFGWPLYNLYAKKNIELVYKKELNEAGVLDEKPEKLKVSFRSFESYWLNGRHFGASVSESLYAKVKEMEMIEINYSGKDKTMVEEQTL